MVRFANQATFRTAAYLDAYRNLMPLRANSSALDPAFQLGAPIAATDARGLCGGFGGQPAFPALGGKGCGSRRRND